VAPPVECNENTNSAGPYFKSGRPGFRLADRAGRFLGFWAIWSRPL